MIPLAVTVTARQGYRWASYARDRATAWGLPFLDRPPSGGLEVLLEREVDALLVYGGDGWMLRDRTGSFGFSPGLAAVRIRRLSTQHQQPQLDLLVRLAELEPGDTVVDATLGLGVDAQVCAHRVGKTGRVVGIEGSLPISLLVSEGLARQGPLEGGCPIEVVHAEATAWLAAQPAGSVDCVLLDPMFQRPKRSNEAFAALRRYALHQPPTEALLAEARRVARRWVVLKTGRYDRTLTRLGLEASSGSSSSPVVWARVRGGG